jgi:Ulp1 family protease
LFADIGNLRFSNYMNFAEADLLIVPVNNSNTHWMLMVCYLREKRIALFNSYRWGYTAYQKSLETYLNAVGRARGLEFLQGDWEKINVLPPAIPFQPDGCNCGLFTIAAADCIARGRLPSGYTAEDMPRMRECLLKLLGFPPVLV